MKKFQADYSARCYGKGVMFLCYISTINPYPVVKTNMTKLKGKGNYSNYDSHFVPVISSTGKTNYNTSIYFPVKDDGSEEPQYDEIVVFQDSQIIPRYIFYYDKVM